MHNKLSGIIAAIAAVDESLTAEAQHHLDSLTKPPGSLGRLEELACRVYAVQQGGAPHASRTRRKITIDPARFFTIAGDHGVVEAGVSLFPQSVTRQMVSNFVAGGAGVNVLCNTAGAQLLAVDAGSCGGGFKDSPRLVQRKIAPGTANFLEGPAMSMEQCESALMLGIELAQQAAADGIRCVGMGEMGIGNTTAATALYCAYFGLPPAMVAGPGTGLPPEGVRRKIAVVEQALAKHKEVVSSQDATGILAALGGLEIAALAGLVLGAAAQRMIVLVDGFISTSAYAAAWKMCPAVRDYAVFAHASAEPGHGPALEAMGARPLLDMGLRLGEGTGAALALPLLRAAVNIFNEMATFSEAGVSSGPEGT